MRLGNKDRSFYVDPAFEKLYPGALKVGHSFRQGREEADRLIPAKAPEDYTWIWDTEPSYNKKDVVGQFELVLLRDIGTYDEYAILFEPDATVDECNVVKTTNATTGITTITGTGELKGTFGIGAAKSDENPTGGLYAPVNVTATIDTVPVLYNTDSTDGTETTGAKKKPGGIKIDASGLISQTGEVDGKAGWFYLMYDPIAEAFNEANAIPLFKIDVKIAKDLTGWALGTSVIGGPFGRKGGKSVSLADTPTGSGSEN